MPLVTRDFNTMVDETLQRIVNANIGITNTFPGSVIRTIVESLLAEVDIQNYTVGQLYKAMNIDTAVGDDLDTIVSILGITRKQATYAEGTVVFGRSDPYSTDISIQYAQIVSTRQNNNNNHVYEFIVIDDKAKLSAGELQTTVNIRAMEPGKIFLPVNAITVMSNPIIGIEYVTNAIEFNGGTEQETDDELRGRAKQALAGLGKGSNAAIRSALLTISGVIDAIMIDLSRGVGTTDAVIITDVIPPPTELQNEILSMIDMTKAAGIDVGVIYPTILTQDIVVSIIDTEGIGLLDGDINKIANAIVTYCNTLSVGDTLIISQLERSIGNAIDDYSMDVIVSTPSSNITPTSTQIVRCGKITINGVVWNG